MIICIILGIISILYGIAVLRVASGTMFFMVWFLIGACFILLGLGIRAHLFSLLPKAVRALLLILIAAGILTLCVTWILISTHFHDKGNKNIDYLIVLGAQVKVVSQDETVSGSGGRGTVGPSTVLLFRLQTAADYLKKNPDTVCVVSGGKSPYEPEAEGDVMARWLKEHGISEGRILIENRSASTVENIRYSLVLIENAERQSGRAGGSGITLGIVTNNFHVFRGRAILKKACSDMPAGDAGLTVTRADGIAAHSTPFYLPNNMLRESMGIVKDFLKGNL